MKRIFLIVLCQSAIGLLGVFVGMRIGAPILPKPNHIWVGFDLSSVLRTNVLGDSVGYGQRAYYVNNGNNIVIHGLQWTCDAMEREGEVLTTEEVEVRPCFAAVYPACPGHAHTNLTRWRWASGAWNRVPETNATIFWAGTTPPFTNLVSTNVIDYQSSATNVTIRLPGVEASYRKLSEILQKVLEALKP